MNLYTGEILYMALAKSTNPDKKKESERTQHAEKEGRTQEKNRMKKYRTQGRKERK